MNIDRIVGAALLLSDALSAQGIGRTEVIVRIPFGVWPHFMELIQEKRLWVKAVGDAAGPTKISLGFVVFERA